MNLLKFNTFPYSYLGALCEDIHAGMSIIDAISEEFILRMLDGVVHRLAHAGISLLVESR